MTAVHIVVAMKPVEGNYAENAIERGVCGLNIDGARIDGVKPSVPQPAGGTGDIYGFKNGEGRSGEMSDNSKGRFPANVIHDGSNEVTEQFPEAGGGNHKYSKEPDKGGMWGLEARNMESGVTGYGDKGSAARFFKECKT